MPHDHDSDRFKPAGVPDDRRNIVMLFWNGDLPNILAGGPQRPWWVLPSVALAIVVIVLCVAL